MKDIKVELDNTLEILRAKQLEVQEIGYYKKWPWKCVQCGFPIDAEDFADFDSYKLALDTHSKACTEKHSKEVKKKFEEDTKGFTEQQKIDFLNQMIIDSMVRMMK